MADSAQLEVLEKRINALEALVFGSADKDALYPKDKAPQLQCIESLLTLQTKIMAAVADKKKIAQVYEKLPELRRYMDPAYTDELVLSDEAKAEVVLAEEDFLRRVVTQLESVKQDEEAASSEHIKSVPKLAGKLQELSQIHIQQQDSTAQLTEEAAQLINAYNTAITNLSKMFVQWDEELTKQEMRAQGKKGDS